jgi:hypothetical protein
MVWKRVRGSSGWHILYSTNSSGSWQTPEEVGDPDRLSFAPALAVLPDGTPVLVFEEDSEIVFASRGGSGWERYPVTSNSQMDCCATIAADETGTAHLAWITDDPQSGEYKIAYATGDGSFWDIQVLAESDLGPYGTGASPHIAVEPGGVAHVVYRGGTYGFYHIHHACNASAGDANWSYEILTSGNVNDFSASLAIEHNGDLHLAVSGNDGWGMPGRTYYFHQPFGQGWQQFELASVGHSAIAPSIDVALDGSPHIVWAETSGNFYTGNIFYSCRQGGGGWAVSFVVGGDHFTPSLAIDAGGFGHVACHTGGNTGEYDIFHVRSGGALTHVGEPVVGDGVPTCSLSQGFPNPFRTSTSLSFHLPTSGDVSLNVYDADGRLVRTLLDAVLGAGAHTAYWNGQSDAGHRVASGVYFCRLASGGFGATRTVVLEK